MRHRRQFAICVAAITFSMVGCASGDSALTNGSSGSTVGGGDDSGGEVDDTDGPDLGYYWSLDGDFNVVDGEVDLKNSELRLARRTNSAETCMDVVELSSIIALADAPHESVLTWWELTWDTDQLQCFESGEGGAEQPLRLGIGTLHPEILAVLSSVEDVATESASDSLNGAYVQLPNDDQLLVFGTAGVQAAYTGVGSPADSTPLPDGLWWVRTAYSLPLSW